MLTARFRTTLIVESLSTDERKNARLVAPLIYEARSGLVITVPAGFRTDLASIPQIAQCLIGKWERHAPAAVLHDWLYEMQPMPRRVVDRLFSEALFAAGVPTWKRAIMWTAVRLGGCRAWRRCETARFAGSFNGLAECRMVNTMPISPTRDDLARMFPSALPEWMEALVKLAPTLCEHYKFQRLDWVGLAGQVGHECNGFQLAAMRENMRFTTTKRILEVYSYRLGVALQRDTQLRTTYGTKTRLAASLVNQPEFLADVVYGGREGTPWMRGSLYIGRGPTQITHKDNYQAIMNEIVRQPGGADCPNLVTQPDVLSSDPEMGIRSAFADWHLKGLSRWARAQDWDAVGAALNTGSAHKISIMNGRASRKRWTAKALGIWPDRPETSPEPTTAPVTGVFSLREGSSGDDVKSAQTLLVGQGYAVGAVDGVYGLLTARAVAAFQREHGLPVDGDLDERDMEVLRSTAPADLGERAVAIDVPGSQQIDAGKKVELAGKMGLGMGTIEAAGQAAGYSPLDAAKGYLGHAVDAVGQVTTLGLKMDAKIGGVIVACIGGAVLWRWGRSIKLGRLVAHRLGLNLSR